MNTIDTSSYKNIYYHYQKEFNTGTRRLELAGYSRCAYRTGFILRSLNLGFDGGPPLSKSIRNFLITHTHADHIASLPFTIISELSNPTSKQSKKEPIIIYCPSRDKQLLENYIRSLISLNSSRYFSEASLSYLYQIVGVEVGDKFQVLLNKQLTEIEVFKCYHGRKPTVGYGLSLLVTKLKEEYKELPGREIKKLKDEKCQEIFYQANYPQIAYLCDTTEKVFENESIFRYPIIMVECTFFIPDEIQDAIDKNHTHWQNLKPIVKSHPENHFILFHFTQGHKDDLIHAFFEEQEVKNLTIWLPNSH